MRGGGSTATREKWQHVNHLLRDKNIAVLALQETHLREEQVQSLHEQFPARLHILHSSDTQNPNSKGVALVLNKQKLKYWNRATVSEIVPGRALALTIPWGDDESRLTVLTVYAPNDTQDNAKFWKEIERYWTLNPSPKPDVVLGDMNFVEDAIDRLPPHPDSTSVLESFNDLKELLSITDGWRSMYTDRIAYTYTQASTVNSAAPSRSRLDRIYVTHTTLRTCRNWNTETTAIHTDHKLVSVDISNPALPAIGRGRWAIPLFALKKRKVIQEIEKLGRRLEEKISTIDDMMSTAIQKEYLSFKKEVIAFTRNFAKTEIPKLDARIRKAKERLQELEENRSGLPLSEQQLQLSATEETIKNLELQRHQKIRDNVTANHKIRAETLDKYWINTG
ncbi:DNase I-like protein [Agrocybe pediades]|nr:DNase I-like protein [Agrocybe pediades]